MVNGLIGIVKETATCGHDTAVLESQRLGTTVSSQTFPGSHGMVHLQ